MNIGIDANCLIFEKAGVGKYTQNIIKNLLKIDKKNHYFLYFTFLRHKHKRVELINELLGKKSKNVTYKIIPIPARWFELLSGANFPIQRIIKEDLDIFFAPYATGIAKNGFSKMVTMVHDLVFLRYPEHRGKKLSNYYLKRHKIAILNSKKIIVPSRATKNDLVNLLNVKNEKIQIITEATDRNFRKLKDNPRIIGRYIEPNTKYILSVGTLEPRKNLIKLILAYSLLPHALQREYKLMIVGAQGWNNDIFFKTLKNLNLQDKIILTGFVLDKDLPYIYNRAAVFVYPSLYEGFGLPPLEAMACGTPVITSNNSSLVEVAGSAAVIVDTQKEEEIAAAIKNIISKPKIAEKLSMRGLIQAKKYSWEKAARQTLEIFENV